MTGGNHRGVAAIPAYPVGRPPELKALPTRVEVGMATHLGLKKCSLERDGGTHNGVAAIPAHPVGRLPIGTVGRRELPTGTILH